MKSTVLLSALAGAAAVSASPTATTPMKPRQASMEPITATGNAFFKGKERFYVRGIDYQPGGASANLDPLADIKVCKPDIEKFKKLGVNTIRVYSTDNSKSHDECMKLLQDAGIYVVLDANNPKYSINRDDPHGSYNELYLQSVFATIDAFEKYPNTMAFFSGNEVIHDLANTTLTAKYVKATDRDMRAYIKARGYRKILVGYSAADVTSNRMQTAAYFNCGPEEHRSDFFAFNDYSWCTSNFVESGWNIKVKNFTGYGLPIFLSEYGCNTNTRDFKELESLMHSNMTSVYSGGLMYEYTMETNKYGIVKIKGGDTRGGLDQTGAREELQPEFDNLVKAMKTYKAPSGDGGYTKETKVSECPPTDDHWLVDNNLPKIPEGAKKFMTDGAGKPPGLNGDGSQWATYLASTEFEDGSTGTGSGTGTGAGASESSSAAVRGMPGPFDKTPFVVSGVVALMTLLGAVAL
ncbi:Glucanosyltransferase-domain-containing protein [Podospora australis]|uniref:1,3-beta-glucanosyltransferase n=1 Tax=Podospora australis TaxID=1536484 RepID=A0AAN7ABP8_9PEZI|nr:Glucanosyltransferase-domain-containing protein [Podospora australis]